MVILTSSVMCLLSSSSSDCRYSFQCVITCRGYGCDLCAARDQGMSQSLRRVCFVVSLCHHRRHSTSCFRHEAMAFRGPGSPACLVLLLQANFNFLYALSPFEAKKKLKRVLSVSTTTRLLLLHVHHHHHV
ncbi:unnamed protein product [Amoebophrya sp. A120]|nr:unnamed protein product [Amoebophrya sp. A120]|eukprot:GSA120T00006389001.1